jgi:hypothetical protein
MSEFEREKHVSIHHEDEKEDDEPELELADDSPSEDDTSRDP